MAKNQAKDKQHLEAELLLFENYLLSSSVLSMLSTKTIMRYSKKCAKSKSDCFNENNFNKNEAENEKWIT